MKFQRKFDTCDDKDNKIEAWLFTRINHKNPSGRRPLSVSQLFEKILNLAFYSLGGNIQGHFCL